MMNDYAVTTIDLLRHGLPEGGEIFRGKTDVALTQEGFQQMQVAEKKLSARDVIITSPLKRCASFADHLQSVTPCVSVIPEIGLREISFGDWDGKLFKDIERDYPELYQHYWKNPITHSPPNSEPLAQFSERVAQTIEAIALAHQDLP